MILRSAILLAVLCLPSAAAQAQLRTDTISEVTVTGQRVPANVVASTPLQQMNREQLTATGATDVGDALKHFAGVQVKDFGGIGGLKTIQIRSLGMQHTGIVYDGVQVGDCQSGQVDLSRFTIGNVSMLSLSIGQQDDIFQSAKSLASAALLRIESPSAEATPNTLEARLQTGSYGLLNPSLRYSGRKGNQWGYSLYADYMRADGNYAFKLWNGQQLIDGKRNNSDIRTWRAEGNLSFMPDEYQKLTMKLYAFDSKRGLPGAIVYDNTYAEERLTDRNYFAQLAYQNRFSERIQLKAAAKWNYSWMRDFDIKEQGPKEDRFRQNETYLTATLLARLSHQLTVSVAQDFQHNHLSNTLVLCPHPSRNSWWTTVAARWTWHHLTVNGTLLHTAIHEHVQQGEASEPFRRLSPSVSMQWQPGGRRLRLRLSYQDIFRTPTLNDLYYTSIGNRLLHPEKTRQWNLGATWSADIGSFLPLLALTFDAYYGSVTDKIVAQPTMFVWKMMNVGRVRTFGIDATAVARCTWAREWGTDFNMNYSYTNATDRTDKSLLFYGDQIAYTPRHAASATLVQHTPWCDVSYNLLFTGERYSLGYEIPQNRMPPILDHSLSLTRRQPLGRGTDVLLRLDINNLGGKNYEVVRFYPMPGSNFKLTICFTIK